MSAEIIGEKSISRKQQFRRQLNCDQAVFGAQKSRLSPDVIQPFYPFLPPPRWFWFWEEFPALQMPSRLPLGICRMQSNVPEFPHSPQTQNDSQERGSGLLSSLCLQSCQWLVKLAWNLAFKACWKMVSCVRQEASTSSGFLGARAALRSQKYFPVPSM